MEDLLFWHLEVYVDSGLGFPFLNHLSHFLHSSRRSNLVSLEYLLLQVIANENLLIGDLKVSISELEQRWVLSEFYMFIFITLRLLLYSTQIKYIPDLTIVGLTCLFVVINFHRITELRPVSEPHNDSFGTHYYYGQTVHERRC